MFRPDEWGLTFGLREKALIPQPGPPTASVASPGEHGQDPRACQDEDLHQFHEYGVMDFVHPAGFGFIKDRRHVAGFQPHQFSESPRPPRRWALESLNLIGLLLHDEPVAYVSAYLPRMDELRGAATRPLERFEAAGLEALRRGEDLVVAEAPGALRMLGAIRSGKQCVTCHGGERGDLLGAFSYALRSGGRGSK
jgi:hypothetical protein